jgi:hypothetical protein
MYRGDGRRRADTKRCEHRHEPASWPADDREMLPEKVDTGFMAYGDTA